MTRKPPARHRVRLSDPGQETPSRSERSDDDLYFYAQSSHKAAKTLAGAQQLGLKPLGEFDVYPVLVLYRQAVELYLKAMILGEGGNFLATKPDAISVGKTRSISWLAQFVRQIVTALAWEKDFKCDGVQDLADFKAVIDELNAIDLGHPMLQFPGDPSTALSDLVRRLDSLLDLLDSTADALAAEWDLRNDAVDVDGEWPGGDDFGQTIQ